MVSPRAQCETTTHACENEGTLRVAGTQGTRLICEACKPDMLAAGWRLDGVHVLVTGDPIDGLVFLGPFISGFSAERWADQFRPLTHWWLAPLEAPPTAPRENGNGGQ